MKKVVKGKEALDVVSNGGVVEYGDRYYRYDPIEDVFEWRDYNKGSWKRSTMLRDEFLKASWNVI